MDSTQRQVYREKQLGLTFSNGIGQDGDTSIDLQFFHDLTIFLLTNDKPL